MNEQNTKKLPFEITGSSIRTADKEPGFISESNEIKEEQKDDPLKILNEIRTRINGLEELKVYLESQLKDIRDENKSQQDSFTKLYNSLGNKGKELFDKLDKEVDYRDKLQAEISRLKAEKDSCELKTALVETHASIDASVETMKHELKTGLDKICKQEDSFSKMLEAKLKEMKTVEKIIEEKLNTFRKDMSEANDREYKSLTSRCEAYIKECSSELFEMKEKSIKFLSNCQKQNEVIIGKIPEQKVKFNKKDMIIYGISFLCTVSLVIQIIMSFR